MGMSQEAFIKRYENRWLDLEEMLEGLEKNQFVGPVDDFPERYRQACRHLAVARSRGYSPALRQRLERMVDRGHTHLYRHRPDPWQKVLEYTAGGFAKDVRRNWPYLLAALTVFALPMVIMTVWIALDPDKAVDVIGPQFVYQLDWMYGNPDGYERTSEDDLTMFGFYVFNNVGIALRTFGGGALLGVGSLLILLFNGVVLGAAAGYCTGMGYGEQFWSFVMGHDSFELTAIVLAGMAGLKIGSAPIWPGRRKRIDALRHAARDSVGIVLGFSAMLVIAAFIEAFWSPRDVEPMVQYVVGGVLWVLVLSYFAFAGRRQA